MVLYILTKVEFLRLFQFNWVNLLALRLFVSLNKFCEDTQLTKV